MAGCVGLVVLIVFAAVVFGTLLFCVLGCFCGLWIGGFWIRYCCDFVWFRYVGLIALWWFMVVLWVSLRTSGICCSGVCVFCFKLF